MRKVSGVCDYFVIASGASTTQVRAIADHIARKLRDKGERLGHMEGEREALWILLDYSDVVVHVFLDETRRFYDLERLWADAPQGRFEEPQIKPKKRSTKKPLIKKIKKIKPAKHPLKGRELRTKYRRGSTKKTKRSR